MSRSAHARGVILIAEDDETFRGAMTAFLEGRGFAVVGVSGGVDAYLALEEAAEPFTALVCDWRMADGDGIELLVKLRNGRHRSTPVVLISGAVTREDLEGATRYDPDAVLLKPFPNEVLLAKIQDAISTRERKDLMTTLRA